MHSVNQQVGGVYSCAAGGIGEQLPMAELIIYTKTGCPYCAAAKQHYTDNNTPFEERNVHLNKLWMDEALKHSGGKRQVPIIVDKGRVQVGFNGH